MSVWQSWTMLHNFWKPSDHASEVLTIWQTWIIRKESTSNVITWERINSWKGRSPFMRWQGTDQIALKNKPGLSQKVKHHFSQFSKTLRVYVWKFNNVNSQATQKKRKQNTNWKLYVEVTFIIKVELILQVPIYCKRRPTSSVIPSDYRTRTTTRP